MTKKENRTSPPAIVHVALIFVQMTFGGFHVAGKYVLGYMPVLALPGFRVLVAAPVLLLVAWMIDRVRPALKDLPYLALLGLLGVTGNQLLFILGLNYTTATNAAIFMPSIPVFAAAAAIIFRIEPFTPNKILGIILAVAGAAVMMDLTEVSLSQGTLVGNLLILCNCFFYAMFLVLQRPILKRLPPLTVIAWAFVFGGIGVMIFSAPSMLSMDYSLMPDSAWMALAYIVLIPTTLTYALNTWAIRHSSPTLSATYTTSQPIVTAILATILLSETLVWQQGLGFALIISGLFVVSRNNRK